MPQISDFSLRNVKVNFNVRPLKFAYFFPENDVQAFDHVVRYLSTQWGGIRNFLVPVPVELKPWPIFEQFLSLHQPDQFVGYFPNGVDTKPLEERLRQLFPAIGIQLLVGRYWERTDRAAHPLAVVPEDLPDPSLRKQALRASSRQSLTVHTFATEDESERRLLLTLFGAIQNGQEKEYQKVFDIREVPINFCSENIWQQQTDRGPFGSVINLTGYGVRMRQVGSPSGGLEFHLLVADNVPDLCYFWNYRAEREAADVFHEAGRRTILLPPSKCASAELLANLCRLIREAPVTQDATSDLDLLITCFDDHVREMIQHELAKCPGVEVLASAKMGVEHWAGYPDRVPREADQTRALRCIFQRRPLCRSYMEGFGSPRLPTKVTLEFGPNELVLDPPEGFRNKWHAATAVDLSSDAWKMYPRDPAVAHMILNHAWFSPYGLSAALDTQPRPTYLTVTLPSYWDSLQAYFGRRGFDIRMSPPGEYATAFINLIGGMKEVSVLGTVTAFRVLDALALKSTKKVAQRIAKELKLSGSSEEELARVLRDSEVVSELKKVPRTLNELQEYGSRKELLALLERLSSLKIVKRGFHAICPNCLTPAWHPLYSLGESLTCPGCAAEFQLPVEQNEGSGIELIWEYTLNSLVNRIMDQDALPAVLALFHETKADPLVPFVPGLELIPKGQTNPQAEFDYLFIRDQGLFAGECKAGTELSEKDIATARLAATLGVKEFAYCTVRQFSDASQARIDRLREEIGSDKAVFTIKTLIGEQLLGGSLPS